MNKPRPREQVILRNLIGSRVVCTLQDGRRTTGSLICIDRLKNMILADCTEERIIDSADYTSHHGKPGIQRKVSRHLQQAMIPGDHLVSVKVDKLIYQRKIAPHCGK